MPPSPASPNRRAPTGPLLLFAVSILLVAAPARAASIEHGKEIFALAAGCSCHSTKSGPVGAGGPPIKTPFGTFYGSNITSDPEAGIGAWTDEEIDTAIRGGSARGKGTEAPVMPYYWYAGMSDADTADLIAYLRTLAPSSQPNRAHEGELPLSRWAYWAWQVLFVGDSIRPETAPASGVERGHYLADHVSLCADCHTPRTRLGAVDSSMYMAGADEGPGGNPVPNITRHETGIADWDAADVASLLESGMMPDFDNVQGAMGEVIDGVGGGPGYKDAAASDRRAIAEYLMTVSPIDHKVED